MPLHRPCSVGLMCNNGRSSDLRVQNTSRMCSDGASGHSNRLIHCYFWTQIPKAGRIEPHSFAPAWKKEWTDASESAESGDTCGSSILGRLLLHKSFCRRANQGHGLVKADSSRPTSRIPGARCHIRLVGDLESERVALVNPDQLIPLSQGAKSIAVA